MLVDFKQNPGERVNKDKMPKEQDFPLIPSKYNNNNSTIRFITFNINGFRTLFQYHPWTAHRNLSSMFQYLQADIITLQELKLQKSDINDKVARVEGYQTFITVPGARCKRKGYAGVSVHVRVPKFEESEDIKRALKVIKAEEGITGILKSPETGFSYRDSPYEKVIGGYVNFNDLENKEYDETILQQIDNEGRVVIIELANNTVVISTYCPANSTDTDDGELFRVRFISILFQRIRNLYTLGKQVILMGDINISRDLIDSAPLISDLIKSKVISATQTQEADFEPINMQICQDHETSTIPRKLLNSLLIDSLSPALAANGIMYDTTRKHQGRKHKLYTVWNTMTNARPSNFGSRIDLILATNGLKSQMSNIWPQIMGSDHCPVYTDFDTNFCQNRNNLEQIVDDGGKLSFEAAKYYKLGRQGALDMLFQSVKKRKIDEQKPHNTSTTISILESQSQLLSKNERVRSVKVRTKSKTTQATLSQFFKNPNPSPSPASVPVVSELLQSQNITDLLSDEQQSSQSFSSTSSFSLKLTSDAKFSIPSDPTPPNCKHDIPTILKTSRNDNSKGRKFWTCSKPLKNGGGGLIINKNKMKEDLTQSENGLGIDEFSCGFFKWR